MNTERFTFFWSGPFSQWHPSIFTVAGVEYTHAEQSIMHSKARLFGDIEMGNEIMIAAHPRTQKSLGRKVRGFEPKIWEAFREGIVYTACYAKFSQNPDLLQELIGTAGTTLVEASPKDKIWGIGLAAEDERAQDRTQWQGLNLLGVALTRVREALIYEVVLNG